MTSAVLAAPGAFIGLLVGMTSAGSGALLAPILLLDFNSVVGKPFVVGTATTYGTITKFVGSARNYLTRSLKSSYVLMIAATGVPTAAIGAFYSSALITWNLFSPLLAIALIVVALLIVLGQKLKKAKSYVDPEMNRNVRIKEMAIGLYIGPIGSFTGVSTGSLLAASLIVLLKFSPRTAVTIAVFEEGVILLAATAVQLYLGHVNFPVTGLLALGRIPGILIGSHLGEPAPAEIRHCRAYHIRIGKDALAILLRQDLLRRLKKITCH